MVSFRATGSVADVGSIIGGKRWEKYITGGYFQNACPIRMSLCLNATGFPQPVTLRMQGAISGADNKFYIYRVNDMIDYLTHTMGKPDLIVNNRQKVTLSGRKELS